MKVCFFGLGSIGKKHLKNLIKISNKMKINVEIYAFRTTNKEVDNELKKYIKSFITDENELEDDFDIIFVTNPTKFHYKTVKLMTDKTKNMFIEKPIFDCLSYNIDKLNLNKDGIYYVARPLIYSNVITEIKKYLKDEKVYSVRSICSSYLPNWRPNVNYRSVYSAKKELGGGVSIDLIHELDYLTYLFGFPIEILNLNGKFSHLEINSEDLSIYIARYKDKLIELHLDYFGRETRRNIEVITKDRTITGDFINNTIKFSDKDEIIVLNNKKDMYVEEMKSFLNKVILKEKKENNIERAYKVLKLAMGEI